MTNNTNNFYVIESNTELSKSTLVSSGHVKYFPNLTEELKHLQPDDAFVHISQTVLDQMTPIQVVGLIEISRISLEMNNYDMPVNLGQASSVMDYANHNTKAYMCRCITLLGASLFREIFTIVVNAGKQSPALIKYCTEQGAPVEQVMDLLLETKLLEIDEAELFIINNPDAKYSSSTYSYE